MIITQIHIAPVNGGEGQLQKTKQIKPLTVDMEGMEKIRQKIVDRHKKKNQNVNVYFVYIDNN